MEVCRFLRVANACSLIELSIAGAVRVESSSKVKPTVIEAVTVAAVVSLPDFFGRMFDLSKTGFDNQPQNDSPFRW